MLLMSSYLFSVLPVSCRATAPAAAQPGGFNRPRLPRTGCTSMHRAPFFQDFGRTEGPDDRRELPTRPRAHYAVSMCCDQPHSSEHSMNPYQDTPTAKLIADRVRDLSHRKTQAAIASEAGFANAKMMTFLKNERNKVPLDRVPSLAKALEVDPAMLMRLALHQPVGATAAQAIVEIFGMPVIRNERGWLAESRTRSLRDTERRAGEQGGERRWADALRPSPWRAAVAQAVGFPNQTYRLAPGRA